MGITFNSESGIFHIFTHSTSYQILLYRNTYPLHLYWGHRVYDDSCTWQLEAPYRRAHLPSEYPAGRWDVFQRVPAL